MSNAMQQFTAACDALKAEGCDIVACVISYGSPADTHFSTRLSLRAKPGFGVDETHIVMDAIREISKQWSKITHKPKYKGTMDDDRA